MNKKDINYIVKLSNKYERYTYQLESRAIAPAAAAAGVLGPILTAMTVGAIVNGIVNYLKNSPELIDNAKLLYNTLLDYKKSYGFGEHDDFLSKYTENLEKFITAYNSVNNNPDRKDKSLLDDFESIIKNGSEIQAKSEKVIEAIESMKSVGGSIFSALKTVSLNFGFETDTSTILDQATNVAVLVGKYLPEIKLRHKKLMEEIQAQIINNQSTPESEIPAETPTETPTAEKPSPETRKEEDILSQLGGISL
jgi:hypothetical protein